MQSRSALFGRNRLGILLLFIISHLVSNFLYSHIGQVLLAAVLHQCLPPDEPIDLLNVTFDGVVEQGVDVGSAGTSSCEVPAEDCRANILDSIDGIIDEFNDSEDQSLIRHLNLPSNPKTVRDSRESAYRSSSQSPDRLAAFAALIELRMLFPSRAWRLVCVDVSASERLLYEERVKALILVLNLSDNYNI